MSSLPSDDSRSLPEHAPADRAWAATELMPRAPAAKPGNALPTGSHLAEFELLRVLGEGGFGIVYLAHDHMLQRRVAIKEYMPASLATRAVSLDVVVTTERHRAVFDAGLESFVNEARLLAQFDHPSLLKVYRFWQANGTAYMVMPFYEGVTLKERLKQLGTPPEERWLTALLASLTEALAVIHADHFLHRDIAPDNILLLADSGRPLLLDFGAARQVIGDATQALTAILKPGYAPVEQYAELSTLKQGPWTDVYALCAVVYAAVTGSKPPVSVGRTVADSYVPLTRSAAGRYSERFLQAIDDGLRVRPDERTPSMAALRHALALDVPRTAAAPTASAMPALAAFAPRPVDAPAVAVSAASAAATAASPPTWRRAAQAGAVLAALLLAGGGAYWAGQRHAAPAASGSPTPAPAPAPEANIGPWPARGDAATPAAVPAPPAAVAVQPPPFSVVGEFDRMMQGRQQDFVVQASPAQTRLRIGRDRLSFKVSSAREGHVYVLVGGPDGSLMLLYPNSVANDNRIRAGQTLTLPQASWLLDTAEPAGAEHFMVIVSEHPRDFSQLSQERDDWFLRLPTGAAGAALASAYAGRGSAMAGKANCDTADCDVYGAARFTLEVVR
jgi:hypothetical protein